MKEQLITFDTAKLAKEKGFENKTPHKLRRDYYNHLGEINGDVTEYIKAYVANKGLEKYNTIDAPTQSLLQKWLSCLYIPMRGKACISDRKYVSKLKFDTYEEALEEGLQEALKLI